MVFKQEDFTEQAQVVIGTSYEVVRRFRHSQWDVEHVMLALLESPDSVPSRILNGMGVNVDRTRGELEIVLKKTPQLAYESNQLHPTPRAMAMLQAAKDEAERLHDEHIATEHLFLAILSDAQRRSGAHPGPARRDQGACLPGPPERARRTPRDRPAR